MADTARHHAAELVLQRALTGVPVTDPELEEALAHVAACDVCSRRFEVGGERPYPEKGGHDRDVAEIPVEPSELFERALTAALAELEAIVRVRAAERLGSFERLGPRALAALAKAAAEDRDREVRAAALAALDRLDEEVSLPERLIEAWSEAPGEAAPFLAGVLARLGGWGVARITVTAALGQPALALTAETGLRGEVSIVENELRLALEGLPPAFERTRPVIALPDALAKDAPPVSWRGEAPGLVGAEAPVTGGRLQVSLGNLLEPEERRREAGKRTPESLFQQVYLLKRKRR